MESAVWWASEDSREYPVASDRSVCIAQWVLEAPMVTGTKRRKRVRRGAGARVADVADDLARLDLMDEEEA
ncbi:hypothetical protein CDD83_6443 [Cordyceps sp. RAO-2017]|nr:hypothetical protein CDD83_6443 [Cordyceps sp. RAO-2017]